MSSLNPTKAFIFRIAHVECVPWILRHGLHCRSAPEQDPHYVNIGNASLIDKRSRHAVPIPPGGTLSDYVPFYFTPYSIMMYNIHTGYGGITRRPNHDIVIFVSSLPHVAAQGIRFIFTNQHAYPPMAGYFTDLAQLDQIDWPLLQSRNFKHNPDDPGKKERYQAEALIWKHVPLEALQGVCCYTPAVEQQLKAEIERRALSFKVAVQQGWYF